jgi:hypothetical protein
LFDLLKSFTAKFLTPIIEALALGGVKDILVISFRIYYTERNGRPFFELFQFCPINTLVAQCAKRGRRIPRLTALKKDKPVRGRWEEHHSVAEHE